MNSEPKPRQDPTLAWKFFTETVSQNVTEIRNNRFSMKVSEIKIQLHGDQQVIRQS